MVHRIGGDIRAVDGNYATCNSNRHLGIGIQSEKRQHIAACNTQPTDNKPSDQQPLPEGQLFIFLLKISFFLHFTLDNYVT